MDADGRGWLDGVVTPVRDNELNTFCERGFCVMADAVSRVAVDEFIEAMESVSVGGAAGARNLTDRVPCVARLAESEEIARCLEILGARAAFLVRSLYFDKQPGANWRVPWHQDLTIAVRERREVAGFGPWSVKEGVPHVQPPATVLERMVTLRLHLDDCDAENGALRVLPGSHRCGVMSADRVRQYRKQAPEVTCVVARGGILAMRPLLLHASSPAIRPAHRRVIHLEFAMDELPGGLEWKGGPAREPFRIEPVAAP